MVFEIKSVVWCCVIVIRVTGEGVQAMGDGIFVDPKSGNPGSSSAWPGNAEAEIKRSPRAGQEHAWKTPKQALDNGNHWFGCRYGSFEQ
jgi:hypothetical protein